MNLVLILKLFSTVQYSYLSICCQYLIASTVGFPVYFLACSIRYSIVVPAFGDHQFSQNNVVLN